MSRPTVMIEFIQVRPEFVLLMERELMANRHKGDWFKWKPDKIKIFEELQHHMEKLARAFVDGDEAAVTEHTADLANLAMKADECHGEKP